MVDRLRGWADTRAFEQARGVTEGAEVSGGVSAYLEIEIKDVDNSGRPLVRSGRPL
jgi:hypothetical protein